ncbi:MAG: hypothetical protein KGM16_15165, partial [Bacteroidota bacterium]|nr:hypothetical protein [Bacteroidota bacterium]
YYPFGLTMSGISSEAARGIENKYKYNGIEQDTSLGLNEYNAQLRDLDPQTGRWSQIDPETDDQEMWSPYTSNNDNPIRYDDPKGNEGNDCCKGLWDKFVQVAKTAFKMEVAKYSPTTLKEEGKQFVKDAMVNPFSTLDGGAEIGAAKLELQELSQVTKNAANGAAFEQVVINDVVKSGEKNVAEQVTIKANNGVKTKVDVASRTETGTIKLREAKASETAPLSKNQKAAHPSIEQSGGVVVGKGKPGFPGGTQIPPTKVEVVRPKIPNK